MKWVRLFPGKLEMIFFWSLDPVETFSGNKKFYSLELSAESKMAAETRCAYQINSINLQILLNIVMW